MLDPLAIIQDLTELIEAIDRRSPQLQRSGEAGVVDAAMRLRIEARARIAELEATKHTASLDPFFASRTPPDTGIS